MLYELQHSYLAIMLSSLARLRLRLFGCAATRGR